MLTEGYLNLIDIQFSPPKIGYVLTIIAWCIPATVSLAVCPCWTLVTGHSISGGAVVGSSDAVETWIAHIWAIREDEEICMQY